MGELDALVCDRGARMVCCPMGEKNSGFITGQGAIDFLAKGDGIGTIYWNQAQGEVKIEELFTAATQLNIRGGSFGRIYLRGVAELNRSNELLVDIRRPVIGPVGVTNLDMTNTYGNGAVNVTYYPSQTNAPNIGGNVFS